MYLLIFAISFNVALAGNIERFIEPRIINGDEVVPNSIPYQAAVISVRNDSRKAFCGGSLISQNYVLTAAHCVSDETIMYIEVVLGAHNISDRNETTQRRLITVTFTKHADYDASTLVNDIAVVQLPFPVTLNEYIQIIQLPSYPQETMTFDGRIATVSGWGKIRDTDTTITDLLRSADLRILANIFCTVPYLLQVRDVHVCGASILYGRSACNGDSGGPFVTNYNGQSIQIGIVSFGSGISCQARFPSVFTRTTKYLGWIENNTDVVISR